jgi:8-oxo-dGTP pyrophosphatase MutT (NUDIX family)
MAHQAPGVITLEQVRRAMRGYRPIEVEAPEARPAAVALILHEGPEAIEGLEALFIKRAQRSGDPWSGQVALPGGRRSAADVDLLRTALRETREETGIDLVGAEQVGRLDDLYPRIPTLPPVVVRPFVFAVAARPAITPSDEVDRAFWYSLERLGGGGPGGEGRREVTLAVRGAPRTVSAYDLGGDILWGMTERILTPFLELISRAL